MRRTAAAAAAALLLAGCGQSVGVTPTSTGVTTAVHIPSVASDGVATASSPAPAPIPSDGAGFYQPPIPLPAGAPGNIIRAVEVDPGVANARAWKVLYHSPAVSGADIAVSGYVVVPSAPPPAGGWPVIAWGHGTTGMADQCAPTRMGSPADQITNLADEIAAGYAVAATDYEGLGTPGLHPYGVAESEARGVLDSVRAARNLPGVQLSNRVVAIGQSQGGGAVLTAAEIASTYAPDLQLLGVVGTGPRTELATIGGVLPNTPYFGYLIMVGAAFDSVYGTHLIDDVLTPAGRDSLSVLETDCVDGILARYNGVPPATILAKDPLSEPGLPELLEKNTPGNVRTSVPILLMHGGADAQIPPLLSNLFTKRACKAGDTVELRYYPGLGHGGPLRQAKGEILQWIADRISGQTPASSCANIPDPPPG